MSLPRQILKGKLYLVTRRTAQRQFLLRPDRMTWQIFAYCLALAARRFGILVLFSLAMSNHHHTVVYDPTGVVCKFMEYFHSLVARAMNAFRGRSENLWSSAQPSLVELEDVEDLIEKLVYCATNPVEDGLVAKSEQWPGFNSLQAFETGEAIVVERPTHYFSNEMPASVSLEMKFPPHLDADEIRAEVLRRVAAFEDACAQARRDASKRVLGRAAVLKQAWWWSPTTPEQRGGINPRFAARQTLLRLALIDRHKKFQFDYRIAYRAWRDGDLTAVFPMGTYWLAHFANVRVAGVEKI